MKIPIQYSVNRLKLLLKPWIIRQVWGYDSDTFSKTLQALGVNQGDTLMVHSGLKPGSGYQGTVSDLINSLISVVGPEGTVAMMSIPYHNIRSADYIKSGKPFDVRKSVSRVGILSETFRRMPAVARSLHPTHPVCVWGKNAAELIRDPWLDISPFGQQSFFSKLLNLKGKIVLYDAGFDTVTFVNHLEDLFHEFLPDKLYEEDTLTAQVIDQVGQSHQVQTLVLSENLHQLRDCSYLEKVLTEAGIARKQKLGRGYLTVIDIPEMVARVDQLMRTEGGFHQGNPVFLNRSA